MVNRRRTPTTRQSRHASQGTRKTTGTVHVRRAGSAGSGRHSTNSVHVSRRHVDGEALTLIPETQSGESRSAHRQRTSQRNYVEAVRRRESKKRFGFIAVIVVVVVAIAVGAGFLAFRGSIGSQMALRDSDAASALVPVRSDEPYYALVAVELGAAAQPLEHAGPDVMLLVRVDRQNKSMAFVVIPPGLQVATENGAKRVADLAQKGDAAMISAVASFAKVDISHYVKLEKGDLEGIIDALDGIEVEIDQVIDDPHAGDVYLPTGTYTLTGASALTYLRADNLRMGATDQLQHQSDFAALLFEKLFSNEGNFAARIDSIDEYFQTDMSLSDVEALHNMIGGVKASGIAHTVLPGYQTEVTGVTDTGDALYIADAESMASIITALEAGSQLDVVNASDIQPADPASFTIEVQNGTNITGAAGVTTDMLTAAGFNVVKTGNAEQPVYDETLVVYKGSDGPGRAKAVINALGMGRAVSGDIYYSFDADILVITGADFKPFV